MAPYRAQNRGSISHNYRALSTSLISTRGQTNALMTLSCHTKTYVQFLTEFFISLGIKTDIHATPHSYCDGDYNLNIKGKKVVGTAQRVVLNKDGSRVVLSQACILVEATMPKIVEPVNLCNQLCGYPNKILADVHTTLFSHTHQRSCIDSLFQTLTKAFIDNA